MTNTTYAPIRFVSSPSNLREKIHSVELQMLLDREHRLEVGRRMRELRLQSGPPRLTQPVIAAHVGLSLRGYQKAEKTGSIAWEKIVKLGGLHDVDPHWILHGDREEQPTPDLMGTVSGGTVPDDIRDQLKRIEDRLESIAALQGKLEQRLIRAARDHKTIETINSAVEEIRAGLDASARTEAEKKKRAEGQ